MHLLKNFVYSVLFLLIVVNFSCLAKKTDPSKPKYLPTTKDHKSRRLANKKLNCIRFSKNCFYYNQDLTPQLENTEVLGYITPWNEDGYEFSNLFHSKFTYLSPVWYTATYKNEKIDIGGGPNSEWMGEQESLGKERPYILPRILIENPQLIVNKKLCEEFKKKIFELLSKNPKFSGITIDGVQQIEFLISKPFINFLTDVSKYFQERNLKLILATRIDRQITPTEKPLLLKISKLVDKISLMTYDFPANQQTQALSPLFWLEFIINSLLEIGINPKSLMLGLNFYSRDIPHTHVDIKFYSGNLLMSLLKQKKPKLLWEAVSHENYFDYNDSKGIHHRVHFPSPYSLQTRINLAIKKNIGIAIWEIGQGLPCYFDLF
ncbi:chitinase domain-containing protein 1 family member [Anaeramoeba flamelloides]|uniref:Chitinase domain-containing protein 1 n=1 Tax=Anaeramoeba flamelloides TaxID=1746091 RepID=A0ABQ8XX02_9EUKA|nr:chitinase domain-containing protein 1 family member [Anaeramoeba flamelloides]